MSTQKSPVLTRTFTAIADVAAYQAMTATGAVAVAGAIAIGFAISDAAAGDDVAVDILGTSTGLAGTALAAGVQVQVGTDGKLIALDTGKLVGTTLAAAGANQPIEILIGR